MQVHNNRFTTYPPAHPPTPTRQNKYINLNARARAHTHTLRMSLLLLASLPLPLPPDQHTHTPMRLSSASESVSGWRLPHAPHAACSISSPAENGDLVRETHGLQGRGRCAELWCACLRHWLLVAAVGRYVTWRHHLQSGAVAGVCVRPSCLPVLQLGLVRQVR